MKEKRILKAVLVPTNIPNDFAYSTNLVLLQSNINCIFVVRFRFFIFVLALLFLLYSVENWVVTLIVVTEFVV